MGDPAPPLAAPLGTGLLFNATASTIITMSTAPQAGADISIAPLQLFPASQPAGVSPMAGRSFVIPQGGNFTMTVDFDTGESVIGSISTSSVAAPALFIIAFLNGMIVSKPGGTATALMFTRSQSALFTAQLEDTP
jgi:hypothetical protein